MQNLSTQHWQMSWIFNPPIERPVQVRGEAMSYCSWTLSPDEPRTCRELLQVRDDSGEIRARGCAGA